MAGATKIIQQRWGLGHKTCYSSDLRQHQVRQIPYSSGLIGLGVGGAC